MSKFTKDEMIEELRQLLAADGVVVTREQIIAWSEKMAERVRPIVTDATAEYLSATGFIAGAYWDGECFDACKRMLSGGTITEPEENAGDSVTHQQPD